MKKVFFSFLLVSFFLIFSSFKSSNEISKSNKNSTQEKSVEPVSSWFMDYFGFCLPVGTSCDIVELPPVELPLLK